MNVPSRKRLACAGMRVIGCGWWYEPPAASRRSPRPPFAEQKGGPAPGPLWMDVPSAEAPASAGMTDSLLELTAFYEVVEEVGVGF